MKVPSGVQGQCPSRGSSSPEVEAFVNECLIFDVLEEKISKN